MTEWGLRGAAVGFVLLTSSGAQSDETIAFSLTSVRAWDFSVATYGERKGFFAEQGINVQVASTNNLTESLQAVIAGSVDIGVVPMHTFLSAAIQGAPVKMISALFNGASDWLWYVRTESPHQSLSDVTEETTIGMTGLGSTSYVVIKLLLEQYGTSATPIASGSSAATLTQVMTGQIDVGTDGNGLLGVPEYDRGEIRPIAYGRELDALRDVTMRGMVVRDDTLANRRDVLIRFVETYKRTMDWMYSDPEAVEWFAEQTDAPLTEAERVRRDLYPEGAMVVGAVQGLDESIQMSLAFERIERAPTPEEVSEMFDIVWQPDPM